MARVTSTEFIKIPGVFHNPAQREPVLIAKHNRVHNVLLAADEYYRLVSLEHAASTVEKPTPADAASAAKGHNEPSLADGAGLADDDPLDAEIVVEDAEFLDDVEYFHVSDDEP